MQPLRTGRVRRVLSFLLALMLLSGGATLSADSSHSLARNALASDDGLPWVSLGVAQSIAPGATHLSASAPPT